MSKIIPAKMHKVKVFESIDRFEGAIEHGRKRHGELSTPTLEAQISDWVQETKCLVVATGPVHVMLEDDMIDGPPIEGHDTRVEVIRLTTERRTIAVTYVPPVMQGEEVYGQGSQTIDVGAADAKDESPDSTSAPGVSDGGLSERGRRRGLRLPDLDGGAVSTSTGSTADGNSGA